ncbi:MAG: hypothetical protein KDB29_12850 [Planctomycetes bacterium]|nr:hypothetical protein [Planctomycetota bacterium]
MASNWLYWSAPDDTDSDDTFKIYTDYGGTPGDLSTLLTTENSADRGDGEYSSYATLLDGAITKDDTGFSLTDAGNFADSDRIFFAKKEGPVILAGKSGNAFAGVTRGPVPVAHADQTAVYKANLSYEHTSVTWGSRYVIRYLIRPVIDTVERVGALVKVFNPPDPPDDSFTTIYGLTERATFGSGAVILPGEPCRLDVEDTDNYIPLTSTNLVRRPIDVTSDADGFFWFYIPRRSRQEGGDTFLLTLCYGKAVTEGLRQWRISNVPDKDHVHFLEVATAV